MSKTVIAVDNVSKQYRLGKIGTGSFSHDLNRWWHTVRGKEDPYQRIGEINDRTKKSSNGYVWALKDISFQVNEGEVLGIIGRNGAGKSTLLKLLSRTTLPTSGTIKIKGRIASLLEVGTGFHPELTGRENIFLNGAILGMTKQEIRRKFDEIVDFSGVEKYIDTPVKRYSSGMYVRLAFAVAAHLESELLIIDEVLAVGDAEFQKKCLGRMRDLSSTDGRTVLFVSHNMAAVENLCKKAILLDNGSIHSQSDATSAIHSYLYLNKRDSTNNDLCARSDRKGDGRIKFTEVQLLDARTQRKLHSLASGSDIIIRLFLDKAPNLRISKFSIAVGISDALDNRVCHISTDLSNQSFERIPDQLTYVDILINHFPLNVGAYSLTLYAAINDEVSDWVQNAYYFNVEEGDFYRTGKTIPSSAGTFLFNYKFNFLEAS